ncbi:efflux RND transporter permease subunit [Alteromonas sp. CYL-A6]|uniref:efflux RND transporter permease subunit n=1 Tax=Alteromonas nitratireducens TaxID=3390813 RepID=UPI0034BE9FC6
MKAIKSALLHYCTVRPKLIYGVLLIISLVAASQLPRIQIDTDPENMLPSDHPARVFHNQVKSDFTMYDAIVVGVVNESGEGVFNKDTLNAIYQVTDAILTMDNVVSADVMSVSTVDNITQSGPGTIRFAWMMPSPPKTDAQAEQIGEDLRRLPLLNETLAAGNGEAAAIYVPLNDKNESYRIAEQIRAITAQYQQVGNWYITGLPVAEDQFGYEMFVQMGISAPLAGLTIFILLFVFFRNFPLITAPMIVAMATVIIVMGALIGMGFTVHIMSSMIAIFLMPIAVVDSVHILSEFSDRYKPGSDLKETIEDVIGHLFTPMLYTSITSAVGFYSLMLTPIPPVKIFGAFVGSGILLAFLITVTFIPAYLSRMSDAALSRLQDALHDDNEHRSVIATAAKKIGAFATQRARLILTVFIAVFGVAVWGISQIQINDNPVRWFKESHEIRIADRVLNKHFAGTYDAYLVLTDTTTLPAADNLLATPPSSLTDWRNNVLEETRSLPLADQLQQVLNAIDDKSFEVDSDDAMSYLDSARLRLEQALEKSKRFSSPAVLAYIADLQDYLAASGLVGKSNSLADVVRTVNRELRSGEQQDYVLPDSQRGVAQTLLQYQSSHRPNDLWHFVTPDYRSSLIWLQLTSGDNQDMSSVVKLVSDYTDTHPLPDGVEAKWAGKAYLNVVWQDNMVSGMLESLISAFVIVLIMMVLLFRSLAFGIVAMLPLTLTIAFIYGLIGIIGKDYDMPIAVLSALTLGLSVDFAIHFIERARAIYSETGDLAATMKAMFGEPATAISRNALVIALGFTPLLFAPLVPYITVGVFLASIMAVSALVTLLMLPGVMITARAWLFPARQKGEK